MVETDTEPATTADESTEPTERGNGRVLRHNLILGVVLVCAVLLLAVFWQLGFAWANGQAFSLILLAAVLWLVISRWMRRRFRFGIRAILVLTMVAAIAFSVVGQRLYELQCRRAALADVRESSAEVSVTYQLSQDGDWVRLKNGWHLPGWLVSVVGKDFVADPWSIRISGMSIDNEALAKCDLTGYSNISISASNFNDEGAAVFAGLTELKMLSLHRTAVTDTGLAHLEGCANLGYLYIDQNDITDAGLEHLSGLNKLCILHLIRTHVTGEGLMHVRNAPGLTTLWLAHSMVTREGATEIARLEALHELNLMGSYVGDAEVPYFAKLTNLRGLNLDGTDVSDQSMSYIAQLPHLERLSVGNTLVSDAGLVHLEPLQALKTVDLKDTDVTPEGVARLRQALPTCKVSFAAVKGPPGTMFRRRAN